MLCIEDIDMMALNLMKRKRKGKQAEFIRRFRGSFGIDPSSALILSKMIQDCNREVSVCKMTEFEHLFWALDFLKNYQNEVIQANKYGVDKKTYRKWLWVYVKAIARLAPKLVS